MAGICTSCTDLLCKVCLTTDLSDCSECMDNAAEVSGACTCNSGYFSFDNGLHLECKECPEGCVGCSS